MDCFIKKIFEGKIDESVHVQFQKFSRGEFKSKATISARLSKDKFSIGTSYEYANEFVRIFGEMLGDNKTHVTGAIITTLNLENELQFDDKKQFMGIKQYILNRELTGKEIVKICDNFSKTFIALSMKVGNSELKIKPKSPKSAKPSSRGDSKQKSDFCKIVTSNKSILESIIFEKEILDTMPKKIEIEHDFIIKNLLVPKNEKDFAKIREEAKREGEIIRRIKIDEKQSEKTTIFSA
jgi:hypothetical protein